MGRLNDDSRLPGLEYYAIAKSTKHDRRKNGGCREEQEQWQKEQQQGPNQQFAATGQEL